MSDFKWVHIPNRDQLEKFFRGIFPTIALECKKINYAICLHGSLRRDLDLVAVPWTDETVDKDTLAAIIHKAACGLTQHKYSWEKKPGLRIATSMPVCWVDFSKGEEKGLGHIDLSVIDPAKLPSLKKDET